MIPEQKEQFKIYGCLSRCLIAIATASGKPITFDDYVIKFSHLFEDKCGCISYGKVTEIIKALGIGSTFYIFRNLRTVEEKFHENPKPWMILCIEKCPKDYSDWRHSLLLVGMGSNQFRLGVFGTEEEAFPSNSLIWSSEDIDRLSGFFLVIR